jgi:hypothetical protein
VSNFYIQDTRQYVGNSVLWWRVNGAGYTTELEEAGEYPEDEARRIEANRSTDKAWPCEAVRACASTHVRGERLREAVQELPTGAPYSVRREGTREDVAAGHEQAAIAEKLEARGGSDGQ